MIAATPTSATWRAVLGEAVGSARIVVDIEGASGEWRELLEQNGCFALDPSHALTGAIHGAVVARHLVSRAREPERVLADWHGLLERGGRVVLLESTARRGLLRRASLLFPPRRPPDARAPYRNGLSPADASLLLQAAGFIDIRCFALPVPPSVSVHYLVSARRR
ncbi:MAG: class I SAM-dependent methyltransferase [Planctomycetes bacterium]|nr:class I SAM-dependent methyltransferase [Planctomycetota bacterium]